MKMAIYIGSSVGGIIGGYLPVLLWHADALDLFSLLGGFVGALVGCWGGYKVAKMLDL